MRAPCVSVNYASVLNNRNAQSDRFINLHNAINLPVYCGIMGAEDDQGNSVMNTTGEFKWWEYMRRPSITYEDYKFLKENSKKADAIVLNAGFRGLLKNGRNSIENGDIICPVGNFRKIVNVDLQDGRFFTEAEAGEGKTVAIIGYEVAQQLYPGQNPIGKLIKINGYGALIIGVFEKQGNSIVNMMQTDKAVFIPFKFGKMMASFDDMCVFCTYIKMLNFMLYF